MKKGEWRELWLDSINELTTYDLQEKSWLDKIIITKSAHWTYSEFMCCYFDDTLCDFNYSHYIENKWITSQEYDIIKVWHNKLTLYEPPNNDPHNHNRILKDKNWRNILTKGEEARIRLQELIPESEKKLLQGMNVYQNYTIIPKWKRILLKIKVMIDRY